MPDEHAPDQGVVGRFAAWAGLVLVAAGGLLAWRMGWLDALSFDALVANREALARHVADNRALSIVLYAAAYVAAVAISVPVGAALTLIGGFLFGWITGAVVTVFAATLGAVLVFLIARSSLGSLIAARAGGRLERLRTGFARDAFSYLLFLRLVPAFPFWLVNIAPALLGMDLARYAFATLIGITPATIAFSLAGAGLDRIVADQQQAYDACRFVTPDAENAVPSSAPDCGPTLDPSALLTGELIAAFVALGIVALIPVIWRRIRRI